LEGEIIISALALRHNVFKGREVSAQDYTITVVERRCATTGKAKEELYGIKLPTRKEREIKTVACIYKWPTSAKTDFWLMWAICIYRAP